MLNWSVRILGNILCVFIAYMESVKQKCRAIYLLPIAGIISTAEKENERQKQCSFYDLITWSTFGKHENSSLLKNSVNITWKSILKLGNLRMNFQPYIKLKSSDCNGRRKKHLYEKNNFCHPVKLARFSIKILVNSKTVV